MSAIEGKADVPPHKYVRLWHVSHMVALAALSEVHLKADILQSSVRLTEATAGFPLIEKLFVGQ